MAVLNDFEFIIGWTLAFGAVTAIPFSMVFNRAGRSPSWAFVGLLPFGIFVLPVMLAFMKWPNLKTIREQLRLKLNQRC